MEARPRPISGQLPADQLHTLIDALRDQGYRVIAPVRRGNAITLGEIRSPDSLPQGWGDHQQPGAFRLEDRNDSEYFGFAVGAGSFKQYLVPPRRKLLDIEREGLAMRTVEDTEKPLAFLGARACDLAAIAIQDKVFMNGSFADPFYTKRRTECLIVAVNCHRPASTCFCTDAGTGPGCREGFDVALTEIVSDDNHRFLVETASDKGAALVQALSLNPATDQDLAARKDIIDRAVSAMKPSLPEADLPVLLKEASDSKRWDEIATRCLSCANCTLACPTCFCSGIEDVTDLDGSHAERWQSWNSCFTMDHSYIHGGAIRRTDASRYRQWLTHKMSSWVDQFGTSGCTGCGRCITWCPVGIDIREELQAFAADALNESAKAETVS